MNACRRVWWKVLASVGHLVESNFKMPDERQTPKRSRVRDRINAKRSQYAFNGARRNGLEFLHFQHLVFPGSKSTQAVIDG